MRIEQLISQDKASLEAPGAGSSSKIPLGCGRSTQYSSFMELKYLALNDALFRYYTACRSDSTDTVLADLQVETDALGDISRMQISPDQGTFMSILTAACGAKTALEIGTFTGYSSLCIARGLGPQGKLICLDQSKEWTDIAQRYWIRAGVRDRIELRLGSAITLLQNLEKDLQFDLVFIDAAKQEYDAYYELAFPRVRPNGLILFDNMLWGGRVTDPSITDENGRAILALNEKLACDSRVEAVLLPLADGIMMCRKRG